MVSLFSSIHDKLSSPTTHKEDELKDTKGSNSIEETHTTLFLASSQILKILQIESTFSTYRLSNNYGYCYIVKNKISTWTFHIYLKLLITNTKTQA